MRNASKITPRSIETPVLEPMQRMVAVDALRGFVIVLMALDHSRDFFFDLRIIPEDLETTTLPLFITRWVTHFCAPTFVLLAGLGGWLYGAKRNSKSKLAVFLLTRGLFLVVLEFTVVYYSLALSITVVPWMFLVLGAIGVSMILLSPLCFLPTPIVGMLGVFILVFHNLLDGVEASQFGRFAVIWQLTHDGPAFVPTLNLEIGYPFLPWFGVMAAGYGLGPLMAWKPKHRTFILLAVGILLTLGFFLVRGLNHYGDPQPWRPYFDSQVATTSQSMVSDSSKNSEDLNMTLTTMSFLKCCKYPPSLAFLLMTLGPALVMLACFEFVAQQGFKLTWLKQFGRAPLFFYVLHFYVLHFAAILTYYLITGKPVSPFQAIYGQIRGEQIPAEYGFQSLSAVFIAWVVLLVIMYPVTCRVAELKATSKRKIWSYL